MDPPRAGFTAKLCQLFHAVAAAQNKARALLTELFVQTGQAVVQPPPLGGADLPLPGQGVVQDIDGNHGALAQSGSERRLIGQAQILTEPKDDGIRHGSRNAIQTPRFQSPAPVQREKPSEQGGN